MDLLGRKVVMQDGKAFAVYLEEVGKTIEAARTHSELKPAIDDLEKALALLQEVTSHLVSLALSGQIDLFLADATLYLEFFGIICIAWQWLIQAKAAHQALAGKVSASDADFYHGKIHAFRYFYAYELPKIAGLAKRLQNSDGLTVSMPTAYFED